MKMVKFLMLTALVIFYSCNRPNIPQRFSHKLLLLKQV